MTSYALTQRHLFNYMWRIFTLLNLLPVSEPTHLAWKVHPGQRQGMSLTLVILVSHRNSSFAALPSLLVDTRMHRFPTTGSITDQGPKLLTAHCLPTETVLSQWLSATGTLNRSIPWGHRTLLMPNIGSAILPRPGLDPLLSWVCSLGRTLHPALLPPSLFVQTCLPDGCSCLPAPSLLPLTAFS